jgi:hypothetical protein
MSNTPANMVCPLVHNYFLLFLCKLIVTVAMLRRYRSKKQSFGFAPST